MEEAHHPLELGPDQLRRLTDPADYRFETTQDLPAPEIMAGQRVAQEAIDFALEMTDSRYNLYVAGPAGTGRRTAVMRTVERVARGRGAPQDWCYVCNFEQPEEPHALALPAGLARPFAQDVDAFVQSARRALRQAFITDSYAAKRRIIIRELRARREQILQVVQQQALILGFAIRETENGWGFVPVTRAAPRRPSGPNSIAGMLGGQPPTQEPSTPDASDDTGELVPMTREQLNQLTADERQRLEENAATVEDLLELTLVPQIRSIEDAARARIRALDHDVAEKTLATVGEDTIIKYAAAADAVEFLRRLRADMVGHARRLRSDGGAGGARPASASEDDGSDAAGDKDSADDGATAEESADPPSDTTADDETAAELEEERDESAEMRFFLRRYKVNILSAHQADDTAPIVEEINPTRGKLLGRIETGMIGGLPFTDHLMIKPGALHRANGGYVIIHALDLLGSAHAWETLKRTLRFGTITIDINADGSEGPRSASLRPEPIQSSMRVVLIGPREIYGGLAEVDDDFLELFKVRADFDVVMDRTPLNEAAYARFAGEVARDAGSPPLTADAVAALVLEGSRWTEDANRLSTRFGDVRDLTTEACYWARKQQAPATTAVHIRQAINQRIERARIRPDHLLYELRENGQITIDTDGEVIGQINGLSVMSTLDGDYGAPTRITARTAPGLSGVINIEREIDKSGPDHDKGVFILTGFLTGRFAHEAPLGVTASICFEQEHSGVDGDSASSAELYALLSSLAAVPIRQGLAVTGAVNQRGEVQAIGGVNEKIEGFFRLCKVQGLTRRQGVLIPRTNLRNLVLRDEVVEAVRAGNFHIYAVSTVDEGIELLTGVTAGRPDQDGRYLVGTINARIIQALQAYNERVRAFGLAPAYAARPVR